MYVLFLCSNQGSFLRVLLHSSIFYYQMLTGTYSGCRYNWMHIYWNYKVSKPSFSDLMQTDVVLESLISHLL
jgi:hypothetical protein